MYKSPIEIYYGEMETYLEGEILKATQKVGVYVDKKELLQALKFDREQYDKGYEDGLNADKWIPCSERLPNDDSKEYIVQKTNGSIDILGFAKDAYKLDKYDFAEYKGKKKPIFYDYDSEYGYIECECEAWQPLPKQYEAKGEEK